MSLFPTTAKTFELRDYQVETIEGVKQHLREGKKRILCVLNTGLGKSNIAAKIMQGVVAKGGQTIFAVHRREIVKDVVNRLSGIGVYAATILPGHVASSSDKVFVGTVQSINARVAKEKIAPLNVRVIIIDEAHHFNAKQGMYKTLVESFPNAIVIGFTATPCRQDGRTLGEFFEAMVQPMNFSKAFDQGWLIRPKYYAPFTPDLSEVKTFQGDYDLDQIDKVMGDSSLVGDVVEHYSRYGGGKQAVLFAPKRASARAYQQRFIRAGFIAEYVDGETPTEERDAIFAAMHAGEVEILCGVGVFTEGVDVPRVGCMIFCRPTKSPALWLQCAGRILRPFTDLETGEVKSEALILDHTGTLSRLGFLEDYEEWSLEGIEGKAAKKRKERKVKPQVEIVCEQCATIFMGSRVCPNCGLVIPTSTKTEELFEAEGELVAVTFDGKKSKKTEWTQEEKRDFYAGLLYYARSTGKKDGWAYWKYKEKFGVGTHEKKSIKPIPPNAMVLAFLEKEDRKRRIEKQEWLASPEGQAWLEKKKVEELAGERVIPFESGAQSFIAQALAK